MIVGMAFNQCHSCMLSGHYKIGVSMVFVRMSVTSAYGLSFVYEEIWAYCLCVVEFVRYSVMTNAKI